MRNFDTLQLFAEGGGASAASAGGTGAAAPAAASQGQNHRANRQAAAAVSQNKAGEVSEARLRELGVPDKVLEKRAKRNKKKAGTPTAKTADTGLAAKPTWEQLMADPEYNAQMQNVVRKRLNAERTAAFRAAQSNAPQPQRDLRGHYDSIVRQAETMGQRYPGFDLHKELDNPAFLHLTGPHVGMSVEEAYTALHHREIGQAIAQGTRREMANAIRAGGMRPAEHGIGAKAPAVSTFDYKNASRSEREAFKKRIYDAAARGEKIYPGR